MLLGKGKYETSLKYNEARNHQLYSTSDEKGQGAEMDQKKSVCWQFYASTKKMANYISWGIKIW